MTQTNITIQTLKENRNEIISMITEMCGSENVKEVMNIMVNDLELYFPDDSIETRINSAITVLEEMNDVVLRREKSSSLAEMVCESNLNEGVTYNVVTKRYEKILY